MLAKWTGRCAGQLLRMRGWQPQGALPAEDCVIVFAPHTSNWDFFLLLTLGISWQAIGEVSWLGKSQIFIGPVGRLLKKIGGIAVDRQRPGSLLRNVDALIQSSSGSIRIALAPEGTRQGVKYWKRGFLKMARSSHLPIYLGYIDYQTKRLGIGPAVASELPDAAISQQIQTFYQRHWAKYPAQFSEPRLR